MKFLLTTIQGTCDHFRNLIPLRGIGGGMGIISPSGELCTLGFARNRRFRAAQSN